MFANATFPYVSLVGLLSLISTYAVRLLLTKFSCSKIVQTKFVASKALQVAPASVNGHQLRQFHSDQVQKLRVRFVFLTFVDENFTHDRQNAGLKSYSMYLHSFLTHLRLGMHLCAAEI